MTKKKIVSVKKKYANSMPGGGERVGSIFKFKTKEKCVVIVF